MTHFKMDLDGLLDLLGFSAAVSSDMVLKEQDKNIIFMIDSSNRSVAVSRNTDLFSRVVFTPLEVLGDGNIQVNAVELRKILGTFQGLSRTKVDYIEFIESNAKVRVLVHESDLEELEEGEESFGGITSYALDNIKLKQKVLEDISLEFDSENASSVDGLSLDLILSSLMPNMDSSKGKNNNRIHFAKDVVAVMDTRGQVFFNNMLPEVFQNSTFRYSSVAYMRKVLETGTNILVSIIGNKFAFRSENGDIETFITNMPVTFNYQTTLDGITKNNGVILDRQFLKDILRRLSIMNSNPKFVFSGEGIHVTADGFERTIPVMNVKGDIEGIEFKTNTSTISSMIVGDDAVMSPNLFMYIEKSKRGVGYQLSVSDETGVFLANTMVS